MSKALNSPTGRLLRNSRLFSLPPPLPTPSVHGQSTGRTMRSSDTATLPYPTHQAISAPASSRARGDWGLKRPLPSRTIPKSNPHLRIMAIDNLEHITDFESAADHTQTLLKWQDMNMPMSVLSAQTTVSDSYRPRINAFHPDADNTALQHGGREAEFLSAERALQQKRLQALRVRWKTEGPWVTSMTEDQFQRYLTNAVRQHKHEFHKFLEQVLIGSKREDAMRTMRAEGLPITELEVETRSRLHVHDLGAFIKDLRDNYTSVNSELAYHIRDFFDLPPFPTPKETAHATMDRTDLIQLAATTISTPDHGPPATHPSAGLSYLLTDLVMDNHPEFGPQATRDPVEARVLRTSYANGGGKARPDLGVAGFVTTYDNHIVQKLSNIQTGFKGSRAQAENTGSTFRTDLDLVGGNKTWVQPDSAHVDERGRIRLKVVPADEVSIGVKTGNPVEDKPMVSRPAPGRFEIPMDRNPNPPGTSGNADFGVALPNQRYQPVSPRPRGFDQELRNERRQNQDQLDQIRALAGQR